MYSVAAMTAPDGGVAVGAPAPADGEEEDGSRLKWVCMLDRPLAGERSPFLPLPLADLRFLVWITSFFIVKGRLT